MHDSHRHAEDAIAVIGIGCVLPDAPDPSRFWDNIVNRRSSIVQVPPEVWDLSTYYDPSPGAVDKSASRWGAFVRGFGKDPIKFRIPPVSADSIDRIQFMTLEAAHQALSDAGYLDRTEGRQRTAVIVGTNGGSEGLTSAAVRALLPVFADRLRQVPRFGELGADGEAILAENDRLTRAAVRTITEDTSAGSFQSLVAGRVANCFNLGSVGMTLDCACASSLASVQVAADGLRQGRFDMALAGGADTRVDQLTYLLFSQTGALSDSGSFPFDQRADGMVLGEGAGMVVLKRCADAVRDRDRVYAVIRGVGFSSDGRVRGITAPDSGGQIRAMEMAWGPLPFTPADVSLVEAHGTGTPLGDRTELESLNAFFGRYVGRPGSIALGSVKSNIGHLKAAAGIAGLIKTVLAIHHRTLPPTINCDRPREDVDWARSPFAPLTEARPWPDGPTPRRAAVESFGFGGVNYHLVLEEPPAPDAAPAARSAAPAARAGELPGELLILCRSSDAALSSALGEARRRITAGARDNAALRRIALELGDANAPSGPTVAIVATGPSDALAKLDRAERAVADTGRGHLTSADGVYFGRRPLAPGEKVAFLYPGQGSQYPGMIGDLADCFPGVRDAVEQIDAAVAVRINQSMLRTVIRDGSAPDEELSELLRRTDYNHPALLATTTVLTDLLGRAGIRPDAVAGHSLGEYAALQAAGVFSPETAVALTTARGRRMQEHNFDKGAMAAVAAPSGRVEELLAGVDGFVVVANRNCPLQTVISGDRSAVEAALARLAAEDIPANLLPVASAFHSPLVSATVASFRRSLDRAEILPPRIPVQCNLTGRAYDAGGDGNFPATLRDTLARHMTRPVEFIANVESLYADGVRLFIEVGPGSTLCAFVESILGDRPHWTCATNLSRRSPSLQLLHALAFCAARGLAVRADLVESTRPRAGKPAAARDEPSPGPDFIGPTLSQRERDHGDATARADDLLAEILPDADPEQRAAYRRSRGAFLREMIRNDFKWFAPSAGPQSPRDEQGPSRATPSDAPAEQSAVGRAVIEMVADRTGYPLDVIDLDMDVEAELGLDSIKQVEIIQELEKGLGVSLPGPERGQRFRVSTLRSLIDTLTEAAGKAAPAPPATPAEQSPVGRAVIEMVADRTGYPLDVIDLDMDVEAELGLDSIKQVEIIQQLEKALEVSLPGPERGQRFRVSTLRSLIDTLTEAAGQAAAPEKPLPLDQRSLRDGGGPREAGGGGGGQHADAGNTQESSPPGSRSPSPSSGPPGHLLPSREKDAHARSDADAPDDRPRPLRWVCRPRPVDGPTPADPAALRGRRVLLIRGDEAQAPDAEALTRRLTDAGAEVLDACVSADPAELPESFDRVVNLSGLDAQPAPSTDALADWWGRVQTRGRLLLSAGRGLIAAADRGGSPRWVEVTALGGRLGDGAVDRPAVFAGLGLALGRCLRTERAEAIGLLCVDFDPQASPDARADAVAAELSAAPHGHAEIGYFAGRRHAIEWQAEPLEMPDDPLKLDEQSVVLAVGGARGIGGAICLELARRYRPRIIVVGRSPAPAADRLDPLTHPQARDEILAEHRSDGRRAVPAEIDRLAWQRVWQRERAITLHALRRAGAQVEYHACDVTDPRAIGDLVGRVAGRGRRIDAVIQGSGDLLERATGELSDEDFIGGMRAKALGTASLLAALEGIEVGAMIHLSSVVGRWGYQGMAAYAAGHAVAGTLVSARRQHGGRWSTVFYGPWDNVGMTRLGATMQRLADRRSAFIGRREGAAFTCDELVGGAGADVAFCGVEQFEGLNEKPLPPDGSPADTSHQSAQPATVRLPTKGSPDVRPHSEGLADHGAPSDGPALRSDGKASAGEAAPPGGHGLLDDLTVGDGVAEARCTLDPSDPVIRDHVVAGEPLAPAAVMLELMARAAHALAGGDEPLAVVADAAFERAIRFPRGEPRTLHVRAEPAGSPRSTSAGSPPAEQEPSRAESRGGPSTSSGSPPSEEGPSRAESRGDGEGAWFAAEVASRFRPPGGGQEQRVIHARCRLCFGRRPGRPARSLLMPMAGLGGTRIDTSAVLETAANTGRRGLFDNVRATWSVTPDGLVSEVLAPLPPLLGPAPLTGNPIRLDGVLYAPDMLIAALRDHCGHYPVAIERLEFHADDAPTDIRLAVARPRTLGREDALLDIEALDSLGRVAERVVGLRKVYAGKSSARGLTDPVWRDLRSDPESRRLADLLGIDALALARQRINELHAVAEAPGGDDPAAWLSGEEARELAELTVEKRRWEWLAGRVAAKSAVRQLLGGDAPAARDIAVRPDENNRPRVRLPGGAGPAISIAHSKDMAVAAASGGAVGVDVEKIERSVLEIAEEFAAAEERDTMSRWDGMSPATALTMIWALKEAARKAVGTHHAMNDVAIRRAAADGDYIVCEVRAGAARLRAAAVQHEEYVFAICAAAPPRAGENRHGAE